MDKIVRVNVTKSCIRAGRANQIESRCGNSDVFPFCNYCPIALALQIAGFDASVHPGYITINSQHIPLSSGSKIRKFVENFDADRIVKPFSFRVRIKGSK